MCNEQMSLSVINNSFKKSLSHHLRAFVDLPSLLLPDKWRVSPRFLSSVHREVKNCHFL